MPRVFSFWRNLFRRDRVERDLDDELRATVDLLVDEKMRAGLTLDEARRTARLELGGVESLKEQVRDARAGAFFDTLVQDVRYGTRLLRRNPLFALTAALSLAIGIGANTAIFTVANALLFRPPAGVAEPGRLVDIGTSYNGTGFGTTSYPNYLDIRHGVSTLSGVYAYSVMVSPMSIGSAEGGATRIFGSRVTANYFTVLGVPAAAGRLFDDSDTGSVVVLSHRFWSQRFQHDPGAVGRVVRINGEPFTIVGVAAEGFHGTTVRSSDVWLPLDTGNSNFANRGAGLLLVGGRMVPGASVAQTAAALEILSRALERDYPEENRGVRLEVTPLSPTPGMRLPLAAFLALLVGIVSSVLVVACANLAGILLARAAGRRREIAMRLAIGATRMRLVRQLLVETTLLFVLGGAAGLLLALGMTLALASLLPALPIPVHVSFALDGRALVFTAGLALLSALASGLIPALQASRTDLLAAAKDDSPRAIGRMRLRNAFVVTQVALSILLVVIAGLFVRSLDRIATMDPGFDPRGVDVADLNLSLAGYTETTGLIFAGGLVERVRGLPGVTAATLAAVPPGAFEGLGMGITADGVAPPDGERFFGAAGNIVEPGYFATLRIPLLAGRDFNEGDREGTQPVVIVSESTARRLWPGRDAVGQYLVKPVGPTPDAIQTLLVIGVARHVAYNSLIDGARDLFVYLPLRQEYTSRISIVARGNGAGAQLAALVASIDPNLPIVSSGSLEDRIAVSQTPQRVVASVSGALGAVGLLLAAIGIYGITAYAVASRTREIGVRLALGARPADVMRMVLRKGMSLVVIGAVMGLVLAAASSQLLTALLFGIPPIDPVSFGGAALLFAATGLAACYVPVRRAARIDVTEALRYE
jgi:putative ABC transport system permease protein